MSVTVICAGCGISFSVPPSRYKQSKGLFFHSRECSLLHSALHRKRVGPCEDLADWDWCSCGNRKRIVAKTCQECYHGRGYGRPTRKHPLAVDLTCFVCKNTFQRVINRALPDRGVICCSPACVAEHTASLKRKPTAHCVDCGAEVGRGSNRCKACVNRTPEKRKAVGEAARGRVVRDMSGSNNPNWNGGTTPLKTRWCNSWRGRLFNSTCRRRDNYTCRICGKVHNSRSKGLHVHHIAPFATYETLRSLEANGACVCRDCHYWLHSNDGEPWRAAWEAEVLEQLMPEAVTA